MKKQQIEIILIILLILLMYLQSSLLNTFSKSVLGKGTMIFAILYITQRFGKNAGILSALIMVLNLYNSEKNNMEGALLALDLGGQEGFREAQNKTEDKPNKTEDKQNTNSQNTAKITEKVEKLAKQEPAGDLQSYVEEDQDKLPDPETWMSKDSLAKFKAYVKKIKKKRDSQITSQPIASDNKEKEKEGFINRMLAPKSIQGIDRQLKKVAEYNKMAVTSQGNAFAAGKFGYVKRPF